MNKKILALSLICLLLAPAVFADEVSDQQYISQLYYKNNRLSLALKQRKVNENRSYSYTDIDTTSYSWEAYTISSSDISSNALSRSEVKQVTDWFIYKGGVRQLSDLEFLELVNDPQMLRKIREAEAEKDHMRNIGNICLGGGILIMLGGTAMSAGSAIITGGAIAMTAGFFFNAFNQSPPHYIQPDYAQQKIDEYNIALKRKLGLPITFE